MGPQSRIWDFCKNIFRIGMHGDLYIQIPVTLISLLKKNSSHVLLKTTSLTITKNYILNCEFHVTNCLTKKWVTVYFYEKMQISVSSLIYETFPFW